MESSSSSSSPFEASRILLKLSQDPGKIHVIQSDPSSKGEYKKLQPEWLERFYQRTFFAPCSEHVSRHNELNKYCIDCDTSFCQYCLSLTPHKEEHRLLKLYRHVYKDVVPLNQIEQHMDCSLIQPYRCNKQMVIALTPLPHLGSSKFNEEELCLSCKRKLIDSELYKYCSISCKVEAFTKRENTDVPPFLSLDPRVQNSKQISELKNSSVDQLVQNAMQETEPNDEMLLEAEDGPEPKMATVDQTAQAAEQEPEQKMTTVDQKAQAAEQEPEPKMTTVDQTAQEAKQEPKPKTTTVDHTTEEAKQGPERQVTNADEQEQKENPEPVINFRKRKRKGIPHRAPLF